MGKRNILADLYVVGKPVEFTADATIWLQKLNAPENERAMRLANEARALVLLAHSDGNDEILATIRLQAAEYDPDAAMDYLEAPLLRAKLEEIEAELGAEEEWSKDGYLQGLQDAWAGGLRDAWLKDNADPEAARVWTELNRFGEIVGQRIEREREALVRDRNLDREAITDRLVSRLTEVAADMAWMEAYQDAQVLMAVRDINDREYLLETIADVAALQDTTKLRLLSEYRAMTVEPLEGKD